MAWCKTKGSLHRLQIISSKWNTRKTRKLYPWIFLRWTKVELKTEIESNFFCFVISWKNIKMLPGKAGYSSTKASFFFQQQISVIRFCTFAKHVDLDWDLKWHWRFEKNSSVWLKNWSNGVMGNYKLALKSWVQCSWPFDKDHGDPQPIHWGLLCAENLYYT